ncbi:MAG: anti-sigma factor [Rhodoferax sp.]|nr:anti-sigma factor [Rhodoferax sp.]MDD2923663.1 anti-sigma factor [Rhodoferax sp.]
MTHQPPLPLTDDELHALVDGQGTPDELAKWQARLVHDPQGAARLAAWQQQRDALRSLHRQVLDEAVPAALLRAARQTGAAPAPGRAWWRYGGLAASLVLAFGGGWLAHSGWQTGGFGRLATPRLAQAQLEHQFVRQASVAHRVYVPEVRHPVEVTAQDQAHLVQWLSKRLGKPLKVPSLTAQGFELVGGRLLPGDDGARAQFMFQNAAGSRVTLYLGAMDAAPMGDTQASTSFRYSPQAGVPSFYWADQGLAYALAGQVPREVLMALAEAVYHQL